MTMEYKFVPITKNEVDSRLDRFIHKLHPYLNQGRIEKALRSKLILVNQQKAKSNHRLNLEDFVQIASILVEENNDYPRAKKLINSQDIKLITDNIIYRDANLIVLNKPSGLAVQGGSKIKVSIDDIMPYMLDTLEVWEKLTHKLVHRLDKETSGILLIALNDMTAKELALAFKEHRVEKKYLAILAGKILVNNGQISSYISKEGKESNEDNEDNEDNAITNYKVLSRKQGVSLVEFKPITGKKHQLRLHSLELGYPILGDIKYNPDAEKGEKLHLHAAEISFPYQGSYLKLTADLPEYFQHSIKEIFGSVKIK